MLWQQALSQCVAFPTITSFGYDEHGNYIWDTEEHIKAVNKKVDELSRGCGCKRNKCVTKQCKCRKENKNCGPGCNCLDCNNLPKADASLETPSEEALLEEMLEESLHDEMNDYGEQSDNEDSTEIDFSPDVELLTEW